MPTIRSLDCGSETSPGQVVGEMVILRQQLGRNDELGINLDRRPV